MAGKRGATSDLNHQNWDREEDPEEAGTFTRASDDIIKKRVIKTAKRRGGAMAGSNSDEPPENKSVFAGFTGFAKAPAPTTAASPFGFLNNLNKTEQTKSNGVEKKDADAAKVNESSEYYAKLKGLNESVSQWISKHVEKNPLINLQPIFKDYEKYFDELEKLDKTTSVAETKLESTFRFKAADNVPDSTSSDKSQGLFTFGVPAATKTSTPVEKVPPVFSFGAPTTSSIFSFGSNKSTFSSNSQSAFVAAMATGFPAAKSSSSSASTVSWSSTSTAPAREDIKEEEENEDAPPKADFTPVVEEGHVYTTRCKLFVKKDGQFADHGVGNLFLKPIADSEKFQLILRAETSLGNLLCNFILSESIPMQRMGKKDVMLVCLVTPDTKPPPVPILLRVKSSADADNLLETLQKHKK